MGSVPSRRSSISFLSPGLKPQIAFAVGRERIAGAVRREADSRHCLKVIVEQAGFGVGPVGAGAAAGNSHPSDPRSPPGGRGLSTAALADRTAPDATAAAGHRLTMQGVTNRRSLYGHDNAPSITRSPGRARTTGGPTRRSPTTLCRCWMKGRRRSRAAANRGTRHATPVAAGRARFAPQSGPCDRWGGGGSPASPISFAG